MRDSDTPAAGVHVQGGVLHCGAARVVPHERAPKVQVVCNKDLPSSALGNKQSFVRETKRSVVSGINQRAVDNTSPRIQGLQGAVLDDALGIEIS